MDQLMEVLKAFGLTPALAGTALVLAVILRYARGMLHWVTSEWTYVIALVLGIAGAWIESVAGQPAQYTTKTALALFAVVLIAQKLLETTAQFVPWLPKDNEWTGK